MRIGIAILAMLVLDATAALAMAQSVARSAASSPPAQGAQLDLTKAFHTRSEWRFVVTEGPHTEDYGGNDAPGALTLCLQKGASGTCISEPVTPPLRITTPGAPAWEPHYLLAAKVVYPRGPRAAPFLLTTTGSLYSGDGGQAVATQLVAYDADHDAFRRTYQKSTGRNNNQEVRFITKGPLRGSVITAEPQEHPPYGYWIVVNRLMPTGAYREALKYRSATIYNDGNPLAVIDSEMPNIERRLGLWKPGQPIPTPNLSGAAKPCPVPTLRHSELWCEAPKG
jgi:hypothetical protein